MSSGLKMLALGFMLLNFGLITTLAILFIGGGLQIILVTFWLNKIKDVK